MRIVSRLQQAALCVALSASAAVTEAAAESPAETLVRETTAKVMEKTAHSAFESPAFVRHLRDRDCDTLILTGVETDVCVLATALVAVDRGLRVILAADAMTSSSQEGHRACLEAIVTRFDMQIETALTEEVAAAWG